MNLDPYASCPCGSGKKFKWCCQPIYPGIQHAWELENSGQHDSALRTMEKVVQEHGGNPEAWGQKALLLASKGKVDEAEEALEKAFALNPSYPFGLKLRAEMRFAEGEYAGALLLARKAADAYDPGAHDSLASVYTLICEAEMRSNRPVAARAALERAVHLAPGEEQLHANFEQVFGAKSRLPMTARKAYEFKKPAGDLQGPRRQTWNRAMAGATARLSDLARVFDELTTETPTDTAAWFNLGLTRAWLGDNVAALAALDRYIELETDESAAVDAAALVEVLRLGQGMDEQCDYHEYGLMLPLRNPQVIEQLLREWHEQGRLVPLPSQQQGVFAAMILELSSSGLVTVGRPASDIGKYAGTVLIVGNIFRFSSPIKERFDRFKDEVRQKLGLGLTDLREQRTPASFNDLVAEPLVFPIGPQDEEAKINQVIENTRRFFEETWIHRPLKSLSSIPPIDAVGHTKLRRKLLGLIRLIEESAQFGIISRYSFESLRRKLGLLGTAPPASAGAQAETGDITAMNAAELSALKPETLNDEQLEKAYQTAYRLDAQELATHFAQTLVSRPIQPGRTDRYPWFSFLIQKAMREGEHDRALDDVNAGQKSDCEHNEGKRRNDYELFRAQVHTKRGEVETTQDVYQRLIERVPRDFRVRGKAAEAMMQLKQPAHALRFAEEGVLAARQANDRDSEQYLLELAGAARKMTG
jgi:tetratricopeptide (TPR) repeat protein